MWLLPHFKHYIIGQCKYAYTFYYKYACNYNYIENA